MRTFEGDLDRIMASDEVEQTFKPYSLEDLEKLAPKSNRHDHVNEWMKEQEDGKASRN